MKKIILFLILIFLASCSPSKPTVRPTAAPTYGGYNYETCEANWDAGFIDAGLPQDGSRDLVVREMILSENQIPETRGGIIQDCINGGWQSDYFEALLEAHPKPIMFGEYSYETCEANWLGLGLLSDNSQDLETRDFLLSHDQVPGTKGGIVQECINNGWWSDWFETLELLGWEYVATQESK